MKIKALDLFCGVGGLTKGIENCGIEVVLGVDSDASCQYAYETNTKAKFLALPVEELKQEMLESFFPQGECNLLMGCAPCQPFSNYSLRYQKDGPKDKKWTLLYYFGDLVRKLSPQLLAMENVPQLVHNKVFKDFIKVLSKEGYHYSFQVVDCSLYGIPQKRKRLVLIASKLGEISLLSPEAFSAFVARNGLPGQDLTKASTESAKDEGNTTRSFNTKTTSNTTRSFNTKTASNKTTSTEVSTDAGEKPSTQPYAPEKEENIFPLLSSATLTKALFNVREAIGHLEELEAGQRSARDPLHRSAKLSPLNLQRISQSKPGGSWEDWDEELRLSCHQKSSGKGYTAIYGRMEWDKPSPTITTQFYGYGSGRFGHPEQNRALSLREGALLQSFPPDYQFFNPAGKCNLKQVGTHIGNAVPVRLGEVIGSSLLMHVHALKGKI